MGQWGSDSALILTTTKKVPEEGQMSPVIAAHELSQSESLPLPLLPPAHHLLHQIVSFEALTNDQV